MATISETEASYMGSPSPLARARAIFTAWESNVKLTRKSDELLHFAHGLCCIAVKKLAHYLCNPVVGAVPGNLAGNVVAFQDVESSDQGNTCMWSRGRHHMVSFRDNNRS